MCAGEGVGGRQLREAGAAAVAAAAAAAVAVAGAGTEGGEVEALQYLFGAAQEWQQHPQAAKGQVSTVGSILRLLLSQQASRRAARCGKCHPRLWEDNVSL